MHAASLPNSGCTLPAITNLVEEIAVAKRGRQQEETIGERLARLRKERGITQQELAERLDLAQPNVSDYERGILRLHGELIVKIAGILGVSADEILGISPAPRSNGALKNRRILRRLQQLDRLPTRDQQAVLRTLDAFLSKAGSQ